MADNQSPMEHTASRDKLNPHWNEPLEHVRESNQKLIKLADFHFGNNVMAQLTNENRLAKATSSIASACLEVTDATCVTMATMRSIILKNHCVQQINDPSEIGICHDVRKRTSNSKKKITEQVLTTNRTEGMLQHMEVALSLSKLKNEVEIVNLLEHAISMMKTEQTNKNTFDEDGNDTDNHHATQRPKLNKTSTKHSPDRP